MTLLHSVLQLMLLQELASIISDIKVDLPPGSDVTEVSTKRLKITLPTCSTDEAQSLMIRLAGK